jgi:hypothetical protein
VDAPPDGIEVCHAGDVALPGKGEGIHIEHMREPDAGFLNLLPDDQTPSYWESALEP